MKHFRGKSSCECTERYLFNGLQVQLHNIWPFMKTMFKMYSRAIDVVEHIMMTIKQGLVWASYVRCWHSICLAMPRSILFFLCVMFGHSVRLRTNQPTNGNPAPCPPALVFFVREILSIQWSEKIQKRP